MVSLSTPTLIFTREPRSAAESTSDFVVVVLVESLPKIGPAARV